MEKKYIIKFLSEKKRGAYNLLVEAYVDVVDSMTIRMALEIIKEDLEKEAGAEVELHYYSLVRAIGRYKRKKPSKPDQFKRKFEFRDANEIKDGPSSPGKFRIG